MASSINPQVQSSNQDNLRLINKHRTAIIKPTWIAYMTMKKLGTVFKVCLAVLFGVMLLCILSLPFIPNEEQVVGKVLSQFGMIGLISLLVLPPVFAFRTLRLGATQPSVSYFFKFVEIALGISLFVYSYTYIYFDTTLVSALPYFFGILLVLHGAIRLPSKQQKKDEEPKL